MITLESIKSEQTKLAQMISRFEEDMKKSNFFVYQGKRIQLEYGEQYVGTIISADGSRNHHTILLPGELESANWKESMEWAAGIGGDLPDRIEQAMLFAIMKDQLKEAAYWSNTQHASNSDSAWFQSFGYGTQYFTNKSSELRARAVRRLLVIQ